MQHNSLDLNQQTIPTPLSNITGYRNPCYVSDTTGNCLQRVSPSTNEQTTSNEVQVDLE